jgi:glucan phosphorylase
MSCSRGAVRASRPCWQRFGPTPSSRLIFRLPLDMMPSRFTSERNQLEGYWSNLGQQRSASLELGQYDSGNGPLFNMTTLALRTAGVVNGVSRLHQEVTRKMWARIWHDGANCSNSIDVVTNGIQISTWIAPAMSKLFERYLGHDWHVNASSRRKSRSHAARSPD